jgi:hypothetical protein
LTGMTISHGGWPKLMRLVFRVIQVCSLVRMSFVNGEHLSLCRDQFSSQKCLCRRNSITVGAPRALLHSLQGAWQNSWAREKDSNKDFHRFDYFGDCARYCYIVLPVRNISDTYSGCSFAWKRERSRDLATKKMTHPRPHLLRWGISGNSGKRVNFPRL